MAPLPLASHVAVMAPLGWALRLAGHDVLVACDRETVPAALAFGLNAAEIAVAEEGRPDSDHPPMDENAFPAPAFGQRTSGAGVVVWRRHARLTVAHAEAAIDGYRDLVAAWRPDVLLTDPTGLAARLLGAALEIPTVAHRVGVDPTHGPFTDSVDRMLAPLCRRFGVPALPVPTLVLDPCPPSLQAADAPPGQPVRYVPLNSGGGIMPEWTLAPRERPRVCVSMGGTVLRWTGPKALLSALEALSGLECEIVVAVTARDRSVVGELPAEVRVVEGLPLNLLLGACDLLVHHGGSTTGFTGLLHGLPQLVLPQATDQFDYASRLVDAGAGRAAADATTQADIAFLRHQAEKLLSTPSHAAAAARLHTEIDSAPSPTEVVPLVEKLAA